MKEWLGRFQVWQTRLATYVSMVNFSMIFYLYIIEHPFGLLWYHWIVIIVAVVTTILFVDIRIIFPESQRYIFSKNPRFTEMEKKIDKILEVLGEDSEMG